MQSKRTKRLVNLASRSVIAGLITAGCIAGCNSIIGLDQFSITDSTTQSGGAAGTSSSGGSAGTDMTGGTGGTAGAAGSDLDANEEPRVVDCHTNSECTDRATMAAIARAAEAGPDDSGDGSSGDGGVTTVPAMCLQSIGKCAELLSVDCKTITGDYLDDNAILLGTLFSTIGAQGATNLQRQQSATLAFEEINDKTRMLPPQTPGGPRRTIVAVSCDEATMASRAAAHLINDLHVAALVGPNTSQDTLDISNNISVMGGTAMLTPSAVASSIASLDDNDLTWLMAPSDVQRAPLMIQQINALETQLKAARNKTTIKFGIIYRDDALGQGTQIALTGLKINGLSLIDPANTANISIDKYAPSAATQDALVSHYRAFAPDIIALAGTAEAITKVMSPLEAAWNVDAGIDRPYYVTIDSAKVPELLAAAANADLRARVRGTGITPTTDSQLVFDAFNIAYKNRYGSAPTASSTGPSYDAAYAIAYAIAAIKDLPVTGKNIAMGLRRLAGGPTTIHVGSIDLLMAFQKLGGSVDGGPTINALGTFGPLDWDMSGSPVSARLEMWCIGAPGGTPAFATSGLFYDLKTSQFSGMYTQCQ